MTAPPRSGSSTASTSFSRTRRSSSARRRRSRSGGCSRARRSRRSSPASPASPRSPSRARPRSRPAHPTRRKSDEAEAAEPEADATVEPEPEATAEPEAEDDRDARGHCRRRARGRGSGGDGRGRLAERLRRSAPVAARAVGSAARRPAATVDDADSGELPPDPPRRPAVRAWPLGRGRGTAGRAGRPPVEKPAPKRRAPRIHVPDDGASARCHRARDGLPRTCPPQPRPTATAPRRESGHAAGRVVAGTARRRRRPRRTATAPRPPRPPRRQRPPSPTPPRPLPSRSRRTATARRRSRRRSRSPPRRDDASADSPDEAGYVPMSEWIEDFDRRP